VKARVKARDIMDVNTTINKIFTDAKSTSTEAYPLYMKPRETASIYSVMDICLVCKSLAKSKSLTAHVFNKYGVDISQNEHKTRFQGFMMRVCDIETTVGNAMAQSLLGISLYIRRDVAQSFDPTRSKKTPILGSTEMATGPECRAMRFTVVETESILLSLIKIKIENISPLFNCGADCIEAVQRAIKMVSRTPGGQEGMAMLFNAQDRREREARRMKIGATYAQVMEPDTINFTTEEWSFTSQVTKKDITWVVVDSLIYHIRALGILNTRRIHEKYNMPCIVEEPSPKRTPANINALAK
jgi:hypothetical protein